MSNIDLKKGTKIKHKNDGSFHSNQEGYIFRSEVESRNLGYHGIICSEEHPNKDQPYYMIWISDPEKLEVIKSQNNYKYIFWIMIIIFFYTIYTFAQ